MRRLVAGVVVVLVGGACSGSGADTTTSSTGTAVTTTTSTTVVAGDVVLEADGASLVVAAEALPDGVAAGDITITPSAEPVTGPAVDALLAAGFEAGPGFELGPSGTTFTEPLVLSLDPPADGRTVAAFLVVDGGLEPLEPAEDGSGFLVPHFSKVVAFFGPYLQTLTAPAEAEVEVPFTVRSRVVLVQNILSTDGFTIAGSLNVDLPLDPRTQPAPPTTAAPLSFFTSFYPLTCRDAGTANIDHGVQVSVPRANLTPDADELFPSNSSMLRTMGLVSAVIECVAAGTETAQVTASGTYSGNLTITGIPGLPGDSYTDTFTLELRACGEARLTQRSSQISDGFFYTIVDHETGATQPGFYQVHAFGSSSEHGEAYELEVEVTGDQARVEGVTAGGGHGFGEALTEQEAWAAAMLAALETNPLPEVTVDLGWAGRVEGILERSGDAQPCD